MSRVLVGIATVSPDRRFLESLPLFLRDAGKHHEVDTRWVWNKPLVEAQNELAQACLDGGYEYLLTIEDDHWGFTAQMLEACLAADSHVCGIPYRSRHMPFQLLPMRYADGVDQHGRQLYDVVNETGGYHAADLIGFGFTLIRADVFRILDRPFFRLNCETIKSVGPRATDIDFCVRLGQQGIRPAGCFDYKVQHRDIDEASYQEMRVSGVMERHSMFGMLWKQHKRIQEELKRNHA